MNKSKLLLDINLFIRYNGTHEHLLNFDLHQWSECELQELYNQLLNEEQQIQ